MDRINLIRNQLAYKNYKDKKNPFEEWKEDQKFDSQSLSNAYFPPGKEIRDIVFNIIKEKEIFHNHYYKNEMNCSDAKDLLDSQMKVIVFEIEKHIKFKELRSDFIKFGYFQESLLLYDSSLSVKLTANSILYYNCLKNLSTEKHKDYIERAISFEDQGCFALTELGHGSDTKAMLTTAHYHNKRFILNSPGYISYKWWIGNSSRFANTAIIFAQLYTNNICHGIHPFIINIRDKKTMKLYPGIIIGDCGPKIGHNNIDNGFIGFKNYEIPINSLLDKYCQINENGDYNSSIKCPEKRFATMLSALIEGRVAVCNSSQNLLLIALTIAGRYAAVRKQFGEITEYPILNYQTTLIRIIPAMAEHFAFRFAGINLAMRYIEASKKPFDAKDPKIKEIHIIASALKPLICNTVQTRLQELREVMGGHGYSKLNMIGFIRENNDINNTWEGDNTVLKQQTAKFILDNYGKKKYKAYFKLNRYLNGWKISIAINL